MSLGGPVVRRASAALLTGVLVAALPAPAATAPATSVAAKAGEPVERTVRFVVVQRSRVALDIKDAGDVRRVRVADSLPRRMTLRKGVLRGWARQGRTVVRLQGVSTLTGERGRRVRLKVVVVGRPQVARRGTTLLTRSAGGAPGNGFSYSPVLSEDGSTVAFLSEATNLLPARLPRTTPPVSRAFAWDRRSGRGELLSVAPDGSPMTSYRRVTLSASGGRALFQSSDEARYGLYLRDRDAATTRLIATDVDNAALSADGRLVTYVSGGRALRLDLGTGATSDLGVASFMAVSPSGQFLSVKEDDRWFVWDTTTRTIVRERPLAVEAYCGRWMQELTDDASRAVVSAGCDHTWTTHLLDVASDTVLAQDAAMDADADASWLVMANGRGRIETGPVGATQLLSSQPHRVARGEGPWRGRTPSVATAGDGDVVAWATFGGNVVPRAYTEHDQIYIWSSGS